jgi:methionine synthase I (cobalamin-dependent)
VSFVIINQKLNLEILNFKIQVNTKRINRTLQGIRRLFKKDTVLDGAMGTMLQRYNFSEQDLGTF